MRKFDVKSLVVGIVVGTVGITTVFAASGIKSAEYRNSELFFYGQKVTLDNPIVSIVKEGSNEEVLYVPAKELLEQFNFQVNINPKKGTIYMGLDDNYNPYNPYTGKSASHEVAGKVGNNYNMFRMEGDKKILDFGIDELKPAETICFGGIFLNNVESIQYDINGDGVGSLLIYGDTVENQTTSSRTASYFKAESKSEEPDKLKVYGKFYVASTNQYFFYATNNSDKPIKNISGIITSN